LTIVEGCYDTGMKRIHIQSETWAQTIQKRPKNILTSNSKLSKDGIWNLTIPAINGHIIHNGKLEVINTCPGAGVCKRFCYANQGAYIFSMSHIKHHQNLQFMMDSPREFAMQVINEIKRKRIIKAIRFNDSGDFFPYYWNIASVIINHFPKIKFYCYTKNIPLFRELEKNKVIPDNFTYVFSMGGKYDDMIVEGDRVAFPFMNRKELRKAGYTEAYNSDKPAYNKKNKRIGLIVHGCKCMMKQNIFHMSTMKHI